MIQRIAVWNTAFLGDAVLTLPLLQTLAAAFPDAALDFYVRRGFGSLFEAQPQLRTVYEYDKRRSAGSTSPASFWKMGRELAARRYDFWIGAHPSPRSAMFACLSGAPVRIGYSGGILQRLCYTRTVSRRFSELHEIERLLELLRPVLPSDVSTQHWPELVLPAVPVARACAFREGLGSDRMSSGGLAPASCVPPLLGLHPGSVWGTKRWNPAGFAEIARRASARGAHIALFAGPGEEGMAREVIQLADLAESPLVHDFSGALSLPELAAFLGILDCYVSNDSGPMHLAWAQRTPVTALFGPTVRELGFFPRGESATVLEVPLDCRPCGLHGPHHCPLQHHNCMASIDPALVWLDVERKLFG